MKRLSVTLLAAAVAVSACSDSPVAPAPEQTRADGATFGPSTVTTAADLQDALDLAAMTEGPSIIYIRGMVALDEPLVYMGSDDLQIRGLGNAYLVGPTTPISEPSNSGNRVGEPTVGDALQVMGGADLYIRNLGFKGSTGHGIYMELPGDASGQAMVDFYGVDFEDQGLSALWIEDQANAAGDINSDASIYLALEKVTVTGTGFATDADGGCPGASEDDGCGWADFDGIRINEGGDGGITMRFSNVRMNGNAGDGIEFDEKGPGDVAGTVINATFNENGSQPQFPEDLEDGFDIDEAGDGGIDISLLGVNINENIDEGLDLDEEGEGDIAVELLLVRANGNADDNIKLSEDADLEDADLTDAEDTGGIEVNFVRVTANGAVDGDGINLEEFGGGTITGSIASSRINGNADDGLQAEQVAAPGDADGVIDLIRTVINGNGDDDLNLENVDAG
ncbi:MAG TPA: hypothetical protein RMF84_02545 [Polyangiaceae bacterium LLY-WYZ-14_1]|nr:hypothetical protein [Polyangiaceae bacterium LLY-WYZ-14_1]